MHIFLSKKGASSKIKTSTSLFTAKSWGHVSPVPPVPVSMMLPVDCDSMGEYPIA